MHCFKTGIFSSMVFRPAFALERYPCGGKQSRGQEGEDVGIVGLWKSYAGLLCLLGVMRLREPVLWDKFDPRGTEHGNIAQYATSIPSS